MGPLQGVKVVEIAGIGPGPFACMMLADMGAEVIRVDRIPKTRPPEDAVSKDLLNRGRPSVGVNLKSPEGAEALLQLVESADALVEGFRPGVMERLGIGPDQCLARNPRLVFGRMTGWGQDGPMAHAAGHDINYIALTGALHAIGRADSGPVPPLNLVGDFGGGGMLMAFGIVCGVLEARSSGKGQVVDAAMIDGASLLMTMFHTFRQSGMMVEERRRNMLDGGAHFYDTYETSDGEYISVGSIEPQFYAELLRLTGLDGAELPHQMAAETWPAMRDRLAAIFKTKTREQWSEIMSGTDVCFAPVLRMSEAVDDPHMRARNNFVQLGKLTHPNVAPRFDRTPGGIRGNGAPAGRDTRTALQAWGFSPERLNELAKAGAIGP